MGKKFINCEIVGPGNIVVAVRSEVTRPFPDFSGNTFHDVDCIEINPAMVSNTAIYFFDCSFSDCNFYQLNLLFFGRLPTDWHWMTPDYAQPKLIEDKADKPTGE